jgi:predicted kinase
VITGRPASGKTTLSRIVSHRLHCPLLSRDEFKEGRINTALTTHTDLVEPLDFEVYETFFDTVNLLIDRNISIVIEAAFQHKLWEPKLTPLIDKCYLKIVVCNTGLENTVQRFIDRLSVDISRDYYHGDRQLQQGYDQLTDSLLKYMPPTLDVPTIQVDTANQYEPRIEEILSFLSLR